MSAAEASFFDGNHCQHVAARDDAARIERKRQDMRQVLALRAAAPMRARRDQADAVGLGLFNPTLL